MALFFESWQNSPGQQQRKSIGGEDGIYRFLTGMFSEENGQRSIQANQRNAHEPRHVGAQHRQPKDRATVAQSPPSQSLINANGAPPEGLDAESFYGYFSQLFSHDDVSQGAAPTKAALTRPREASPKLRTAQGADATPQVYVGDPNDLLDQHVAYQMKKNPEAQKRLKVTRKSTGVYDLNGHEIRVEWKYADDPREMGHLVCVDGQQRQPFRDYIQTMVGNCYGNGIPSGSGSRQHVSQRPSVAQFQSRSERSPESRNAEPSHGHARSPPPAVSRGLAAQRTTAHMGASPMASTRSVAASAASANAHQHLLTHNQQADTETQGVLDNDDLIDQHVRYELSQAVGSKRRPKVERKHAGVYEIGGREVHVEWEHAARPGVPGHLVVIDGPMRQPFVDYLKKSEDNVEYDSVGLERSTLEKMPLNTRLTFEEHQVDNRLDAMKLAKAQAQFREKAADFATKGQEMPADFMEKYQKTLKQKLGKPIDSKQRFRPPATPQAGPLPPGAMPSAAAGATAPSPCNAVQATTGATVAPTAAPPQMVPPSLGLPVGQSGAPMVPGALAPAPATGSPVHGTPTTGAMPGYGSPPNAAWPVRIAGVPCAPGGSVAAPPQWPRIVVA